MFQKILAYAGPYKRKIFLAAAVIFLAVLGSILPFVAAWQIITPLIQGERLSLAYMGSRTLLVLAGLVLHAVLYIQGLVLSHEAAY